MVWKSAHVVPNGWTHLLLSGCSPCAHVHCVPSDIWYSPQALTQIYPEIGFRYPSGHVSAQADFAKYHPTGQATH